MTVAVPD